MILRFLRIVAVLKSVLHWQSTLFLFRYAHIFLAVMWHDAVIFLTIPDAFSKVILVGGSTIPWYTEEGVRVIGVLDFLLDPERVLLHMY